jgi:Dolichyl-phosphate-mannose-protein mannosyltransferase
MLKDLIIPYWKETERILRDGRLLFPLEHPAPGDARMILHPPGYSIALAAIFKASGDYDSLLRSTQLIQIVCDSVAAALVFLIAAELLPFAVAIIAGLLVAVSPHLSFYSLWLTPDSLAALPILAAVYLIIRGRNRPRVITAIAAGVMIGVSCWLRSNALLLAPFLAAVIVLVIEAEKRWRYSLLMVAATVVVISPITIRNWVVFHRFIPLSLASGLNLIQGIGEYDKEGRFGMPIRDPDADLKDVEWHGRPDYGQSLWNPDGIERDKYRFARGLEVVRSNPVWFAGVMLRRAIFMLRYNESGAHDWPVNTATVPVVSKAPGSFLLTRYARAVLRSLQRNLFRTYSMLPMVLVGMALLALGGRGKALMILLAAPVYYLCLHSAFSTEYRYVLAIHYFLFIAAAVAYYCLGLAFIESARRVLTRVNPRSGLGPRTNH